MLNVFPHESQDGDKRTNKETPTILWNFVINVSFSSNCRGLITIFRIQDQVLGGLAKLPLNTQQKMYIYIISRKSRAIPKVYLVYRSSYYNFKSCRSTHYLGHLCIKKLLLAYIYDVNAVKIYARLRQNENKLPRERKQ